MSRSVTKGRLSAGVAAALALSVVWAVWRSAREDRPVAETPFAEAPPPAVQGAADEPEKPAPPPRRHLEPDLGAEDAPSGDAAEGRGLSSVRVVAAGDAPLAGARVVCEDADGGVRATITGADGVARLDPAIRASFVRVTASSSGMVTRSRIVHRAAIEAGEACVLELVPGGACDGIVVDDETGRVIAGARVTYEDGVETFTGTDGRFRLEGVPAQGDVSLRVAEPRHVAARAWAQADDTGSRPPLQVRMEPAGALRGRVTTASGTPIHRAMVRASGAVRPSFPGHTVRTSGSAHATTTAADGTYELGGLALGVTWSVRAARAGFLETSAPDARLERGEREAVRDLALPAAGRLKVVALRPDGGPAAFARVELAGESGATRTHNAGADGLCEIESPFLGAGTLTVVASRLAPCVRGVDVAAGATETVTVRLDAGAVVSGLAVDDAGTPLPGAWVTVLAPPALFGRGAKCDADAAFRFEGMSEGACELLASAEGHARGELATVTAPATAVRVVVPRKGSISFQLRAPGTERPQHALYSFGSTSNLRPFTDEVVRFPFDPGEQTVGIRVDGYVPIQVSVTVRAGEDATLGVLTLDPGVSVEGFVRDREGRPLECASVALLHGGVHTTRTLSDAGGAFRIGHAAAGDAVVLVDADGFVSASSPVVAGRGEPVVVALSRAPRVRGTVRGADDPRRLQVYFHLHEEGRRRGLHSVGCDAQGAFEATLQPGSWTVVVMRRDADEVARAEVTLVADKDETIELAVER